jgi:nitrate reductase gamma subunit
MRNGIIALAAVTALVVIGLAGPYLGLAPVFGVAIPYLALVVFIGGMVYRMYRWARAPVPFRIPTTCGQEKSLPWIERERLDNPATTLEVLGRMALEVLFFRSLFRNKKTELRDGRLIYGEDVLLWAGALAFHWSFLAILARHLRFFTEPTPLPIEWLAKADGFFELFTPTLFLTDMAIVGALTFLFIRRVLLPQVRYISLPADYFALFLLLAIALTGILMRQIWKVDIVSVKKLAMGLAAFSPMVPDGIGRMFYLHLFLVSSLLIYFPFSKLVHLGGVFLSPTRNLANNNRAVRHVNPWDYPVKVHTYQEWEEEFHDVIKGCGLPLEKE